MNKTVILLLSVLLGACAAPPVVLRADQVFNDHLFASPRERIGADAVFALDDEMRHFLKTEIARQVRLYGPREALYKALYDQGQLKLDYDATFTRTAAQAFAARSGNCLSLAVMTGAFAKELGLQVVYQSVVGKQSWSRPSDGLYFASGHVNLSLGEQPSQIVRLADGSEAHQSFLMTIDFVPPEEMRAQRRRVLKEQTVMAMFMNNRSAETLILGQLDEAYWWARASIQQDPQFTAAYNTMGVIYRRHGNLNEAAKILNLVLEAEPENIQALSNLSLTYTDLGRSAEAQMLASRVKQLRANPPFYFFDQGLAAMKKEDYRTAREMFTKELNRDQSYHEFHAWIAAAYAGLDDWRQARRHLSLAIENSPTPAERNAYAHKLAQISTGAVQ